jgi:hypothetical protein
MIFDKFSVTPISPKVFASSLRLTVAVFMAAAKVLLKASLRW